MTTIGESTENPGGGPSIDLDAPPLESPPVDSTDVLEPGPGPAWVHTTKGSCPICDAEFDDERAYVDHLADEHDLHDDEGTASEFGEFIVASAPVATDGATFLMDDHLERRKEAPDLGRPTGWVALVVFLVMVLVGSVSFVSFQGEDPDGAEPGELALDGLGANRTAAAVATRGEPGATPTTVAAQPSQPSQPSASPTTTAPPAATPTTVPARPSQPSASPTTTAPPSPTTTTTAPPAPTFAAPTATSARIDRCERRKDEWIVTYSWLFSGGSLWRPLNAYKALGSGRYQHSITVPRRDDTTIAKVYVRDPDGARHGVTLQPALTSASC